MNSELFWQVFLETGAPEAYLMFQKMRRTEDGNVFDHEGIGTEAYGLQ